MTRSLDEIPVERIFVSRHAIIRYIERFRYGCDSRKLARLAKQARPVKQKEYQQLGLKDGDDEKFWLITGHVLLLMKPVIERGKTCAVVVTVMSKNMARRGSTHHRNTVTKRPKKPRKRKRG